MSKPPRIDLPAHTPGVPRGEEFRKTNGPEPGREGKRFQRTARDATSINADKRGPIDPRMPQMPPC